MIRLSAFGLTLVAAALAIAGANRSGMVAATSEAYEPPDYLLSFEAPFSPGENSVRVERWLSRCNDMHKPRPGPPDVCGFLPSDDPWRTAPFGAEPSQVPNFDAFWLEGGALVIADTGVYRVLHLDSGKELARGSVGRATLSPRCAVGENRVHVRLDDGRGAEITLSGSKVTLSPANDPPTCRFRADTIPRKPEEVMTESTLRRAYARPLDLGLKEWVVQAPFFSDLEIRIPSRSVLVGTDWVGVHLQFGVPGEWFVAFDPKTGHELWSFTFSPETRSANTPHNLYFLDPYPDVRVGRTAGKPVVGRIKKPVARTVLPP